MFNARWIGLILLMALLGLALQQSALLMLAVLLSTIVPLAALWNRYALRRVEYRRHLDQSRIFAGEAVGLELQVTNRKLLPLAWLRIQDEFPKGVTVVDEEIISGAGDTFLLVNHFSLRWYERVGWSHQLLTEKRGFYSFGPAELSSGDIFGLFNSDQTRAPQDVLIVYPQVKPLEQFGLPSKELFGEVKADQRIFEDPSRTIGVRDYGPGDEFKRIHWKATARRPQLQVKVYEPTTTSQIVLLLNIATLPKYWQGIVPSRLERAISLAASLASYAIDRRFQVGCVANGCWPYSEQQLRVLPSRDPDQLMHILEALAAVSSMPTGPFEDLLTRESPALPWGATLVIISSVVTDEIMASMMSLRDAGRRQVLISLAEERPDVELPGIPVFHLGDGDDALVGLRLEG